MSVPGPFDAMFKSLYGPCDCQERIGEEEGQWWWHRTDAALMQRTHAIDGGGINAALVLSNSVFPGTTYLCMDVLHELETSALSESSKHIWADGLARKDLQRRFVQRLPFLRRRSRAYGK